MPQETWTLNDYWEWRASGQEPAHRTPTTQERQQLRLARPAPLPPHDRFPAEPFPPGAVIGTSLLLHVISEKNARGWQAKARRTQAQRRLTFQCLMYLWAPVGLPLVVTLTRIAPRALDDDNLATSLSAVRDGVSDWLAGILHRGEDRQAGLVWQYTQRRGPPRFYAVEISVWRPKRKEPTAIHRKGARECT